jgi:hypothetical protein
MLKPKATAECSIKRYIVVMNIICEGVYALARKGYIIYPAHGRMIIRNNFANRFDVAEFLIMYFMVALVNLRFYHNQTCVFFLTFHTVS